MTKAAALDYAKKNVRVNAVGPGPVETPLLAKGTGGDPHSYAAFVPRPHTAASTAKAAANALALADCLTDTGGDVVEALRRWEPDQMELGERLRDYGRRLGNRSQFDR